MRTNSNSQANDNLFDTQLKIVYSAFIEKPMTMKEVDIETGIMRENICRYVDILLEKGLIAIIRKRRCKITRHTLVNEYTGNPALFPKSNQLDLFCNYL